MRTYNFMKKITLDRLTAVSFRNEIMGTRLVQGNAGEITVTAELNFGNSNDSEEIQTDDILSINIDEDSGVVEMEVNDFDFDLNELSGRSEIVVTLPAEIKVSVETDNYFIYASGMQNEFEISNENGPVRLDDCTGNIHINNENGPVKLSKLIGNITIEQENGPISSDNISGQTLNVTCENGPVKMRECQFDEVSIRNENGMVFYESMPVDSGSIEIQNENGHIHLAISPLQGFSLEAAAELGQIKNNFMGQEATMFDSYKLEFGDQALKIRLTTETGMIKFSSSDLLGNDFFSGKLDYIKEMLKDNSEQGMKEIHKSIGQLIAALSKIMDKVNEDAVRAKIEKALATLNAWKAKINDPKYQENLKSSLEGISKEVGQTVQEALKATHEAMKAAKEKYSEELKPHIDKHIGKGKNFFNHFKGFDGFRGFGTPPIPPVPPVPPVPPTPSREKEAMQDKARMKILEMLEAGKITSEEAEKLLKAIH